MERRNAGPSRWGRSRGAGSRSAAHGNPITRPVTHPATRAITLGMQRVLAVRLTATRQGVVADAIGVLHHRPAVQRIPMGTAAALAARGVPVKVPSSARRRGAAAAPGGR